METNRRSKQRRPRVYVINNSGHDFARASEFGDIIYLSEGVVDFTNVNLQYRWFVEKMWDSTPDDYILVTSLHSMCTIAGWIMGILGHPLRLLLHDKGHYVQREIVPRFLFDYVGKKGGIIQKLKDSTR